MKRVPPELDSLMWTLAEEGNERAIDEFGGRHQEHRAELLRRIAMVKGLRGEKRRTTEPIKAIPRFVPKEPKSSGPVYVVTGLVLAAVAALAFAATTLLTPAPHRLPDDGKPLPTFVVSTAPPSYPDVPIVRRDNREASSAPPVNQVAPDTILKPKDLRVDQAPLLSVLEMMAQVCGVRIDPAPGMPNPEVVVNYQGMTAMEMLRDLGQKYGFTPLDQHDGSILVVPAVDNGSGGFVGDQRGQVDHHKLGG